MTIKKMKEELFKWTDYYGQDLVNTEIIKKAKTKQDCINIINAHINFLWQQNIDAITHAEQFKKKLGE